MKSRLDTHETAIALRPHIGPIAVLLTGSQPISKTKTEWRFGSRGSLSVEVGGPKMGIWCSHEDGVGGDPIDLIRHCRKCSVNEARLWALAYLGRAPEPPTTQPPHAAEDDKKTIARISARRIWSETTSLNGTAAERYLQFVRNVTAGPAAPLRFHPACPCGRDRFPALVALMTNPITGEPCGIHRTFLKPDGSDKADIEPSKRMLGDAGVIRLVPDEGVTMGLGIAEGIETALAIMQHTGWRPIWAACSAGAIAKFPVLAGIEALTIFADHDAPQASGRQPGLDAARACAKNWHEAGREVAIQLPPLGFDWDDALKVTHCDP